MSLSSQIYPRTMVAGNLLATPISYSQNKGVPTLLSVCVHVLAIKAVIAQMARKCNTNTNYNSGINKQGSVTDYRAVGVEHLLATCFKERLIYE